MLASVPFIIGFTVVFVLLGAGAAAIGSVVDKPTQPKIAGFVLIVLGLAFMGLLPWPERAVAPGLLAARAAARLEALLGGAFAVCAAPCIGTVLASILVLARARARSRAASCCSSRTRSGSARRSCSPASRSRMR